MVDIHEQKEDSLGAGLEGLEGSDNAAVGSFVVDNFRAGNLAVENFVADSLVANMESAVRANGIPILFADILDEETLFWIVSNQLLSYDG